MITTGTESQVWGLPEPLGLRVRFPNGEEATTVPTHASVKLQHSGSRPLLRLAARYARARLALSRLRPIHKTLTMGESFDSTFTMEGGIPFQRRY